MTLLDEIKKQILAASKEADKPQDQYHEMARLLVNIERQAFYGDENERNRLKKMREAIDSAIKRGES
ncbi:hypothetical protein [Shewanella gaetbuli]